MGSEKESVEATEEDSISLMSLQDRKFHCNVRSHDFMNELDAFETYSGATVHSSHGDLVDAAPVVRIVALEIAVLRDHSGRASRREMEKLLPLSLCDVYRMDWRVVLPLDLVYHYPR